CPDKNWLKKPILFYRTSTFQIITDKVRGLYDVGNIDIVYDPLNSSRFCAYFVHLNYIFLLKGNYK
ncbi:MAG TPA: hypothetical protein VFJ51_07760, partial [Nitrososphaeraceae archaeon]|nr:hypothetical protein [Nitrososphaeraceae archaeon]